MRRGRASRAIAGSAALLLAALSLAWLGESAVPKGEGEGSWRGYRVLLVDSSVVESEVLARLSEAGLRSVISESTEPVSLSDWAGLETTSLRLANARLVEGDPRLDDYIRRLSGYFQATVSGFPYRAYYIKSSGAPALRVQISRALKEYDGRFLLPEGGAAGPSGGSTAFLLALTLLLISCVLPPIGASLAARRIHATRLIGPRSLARMAGRLFLSLPWAILAFGGLSAAAIATLWALALTELTDYLEMPLEEIRFGRGAKEALASLGRLGPPPLVLPLAAIAAACALDLPFASLGPTLLASVASFAAFLLPSGRRAKEHRFVPLPIARPRRAPGRAAPRAPRLRAALACFSVLVWGLFRLLSSAPATASDSIAAFPRPYPTGGSVRPLIAEARRAGTIEAAALPGLASYLEHRAYQQALPFLRLSEPRPDPFAPAMLPMPPGKAQAAPTTSAKEEPEVDGVAFDDEWARASYRDIPPLSIEGMLVSQGRAVAARTGAGRFQSLRPLASIGALLYILLLVPLLGKIIVGMPIPRDTRSGELRQEA